MLNKNSYKSGVLWMLLFNVIARGISFVLSIILAKNFLPADTDVYLYVWSLINIVMVIVSAVNLMAAGPEYIRLCETGEFKAAADLNSAMLNIYLLPLMIFSLFTLVVPVGTYHLISGFSNDELRPFSQMLQFSGIWLMMVILNNFLGNVLLNRKYFVGSVIGQVIAAGTTLIFIVLFKDSLGIMGFFLGQITGNLLCFFFYIFQLNTRIKQKFKLFYFRVSGKVVKELLASVSIAIPTLVINFLLMFLLSKLVSGQLSAYNYGSTLSNLPDVILMSQFMSVVGVKFSEISANQQREVLFGALRYFGNHVFFFMSGVAIIMSLISPIVIQFFYGKENLGEPTYNAAVLALAAISSTLAFRSLDVLHNRVFAALQGLSVLMKYTIPAKLLGVAYLLLLYWQWGFAGIVIHQATMPVIIVGLEFYLLGKYLPAKKIKQYVLQILLLTIGSIGIYFLGRFLLNFVFDNTSATIQVVVVCVLALVLGILFEKVFKITMLFDVVLKRVTQFVKRPATRPDTSGTEG